MAYCALDADKMLDIYIYDYLMKRNHSDSAQIFLREAGVPTPTPTAIDAPGGFLFEWWSVFWDVFISRYKRLGPTRDELHGADHQNILNQLQLQQLGNNISLQPSVVNRSLSSQKPGNTNALSKRKLEESGSLPVQRDTFAVEGKKRNCKEIVGHAPDLSRALVLRPMEGSKSHVMQSIHDVSASSTKIDHNEQLLTFPGFVGPMANNKATISDGSFYGANVTGPPVNDFPLEGWPLKSFQPPFLKGHHVFQHNAQYIDPGKFSEFPIYQARPGDQVAPSGSGRNYDGGSFTSYQARICQIFGKGNHPSMFLDPSNSSGTVNDIGLTSSALDIVPSTQATEDTSMTLLASPLDISSSNTLVSETAVVGPQASESDQADLDKFVNNESGVDISESFMCSSNIEGDKITAACLDARKDMILVEDGAIPAGSVNLCDFSFDGKLLASCANDKKVVLWCTDSKEQKCVMYDHSETITDLRFGPDLSRIATSSYDKTVRIWNVNNPGKSLRTLKGHGMPVLSLDFHPKRDLICSCDGHSAIRFWNVQSGCCTGVSRGGATQVRFQPSQGKYLAAAVQNVVSIIDVETAQSCRLPLKGHTTDILSLCWNSYGDHLVSLSEDLLRVWKFGRGEVKQCERELSISAKQFTSCVFHPVSPSLLVIGFSESLELWDMAENKLVTVLRQPVTTLAASPQAGLVASAGGVINVWK